MRNGLRKHLRRAERRCILFKSCLGMPENRLGYLVPCDILIDGVNTVTVINHSDLEISFQYVDLVIR